MIPSIFFLMLPMLYKYNERKLQKCLFVAVIVFVFGMQGWGQTSPINESFSNVGPYGGYQTETWTGDDGGTWTATDARTDQTINGKAICIRNGELTSPTVSGGIGSLTVTTERAYAGGSGDMDVRVNGTSVGSIPYDGTEQTTTINNINVAGNVIIVIDATNSSSDRPKIDDLSWTAYTTGPTITLSESSLTGFSYEEGNGPSAEQTFTIEGSNLTDDITLTAPTNHEISETSGSGFGNSITLTESGGSITTTTIYVRLKSGLTIGTYNNENITASSSGATDQTVTCDGEVTCPSLSDPTATEATSALGTSFTANWDAVSGATGYELDVYQPGSALVETFTSIGGGTTSSYLNRTWTGDGGIGWTAYKSRIDQVVYTENDAICLKNETGAYIESDAITGSITSIEFDVKQVFSGTGGQLTVKVLHGDGFADETTVGTISYSATTSQFSESVSGVSGDYKIRIDNNTSARPVIDNLSFGFSTSYVTGYNAKDVGNVTTYDVSGLTAGETYYYVVRAYNDCGSESVNSNEIEVNLSCTVPTTEASDLTFPNTQYDQMDVSWTNGDGDYRMVVASTSTISGTPADNTSYSADANFGDGDELNPGEFVVFAGSGNNFTMTGLNSDTEYFIKVFEYNCDSGNEKYLTTSPLSGSETTLANISAVTGFDVTCTTETTATVEWTNPSTGNWSGVIIAIRNSTNPVHTLSDDPSTVSADAVFGNGHEFGTTTPYSYVVYKGPGTSVTLTGLTQGQDYALKAISYYGSLTGDETTTTISELDIAEVTAASATTENSRTNLSWSNPGACYDEILVVGHEASSVTAVPSGDGSAYTASGSFGAGTDIGTNEYVVYKGTSSSVTVTGLTNGTTYYFTIFVRVGTEWSEGIEVFVTPSEVTDFIPGDLAIIAVNTNYQEHATLGDFEEFTFVAFKDINVGTSIDFTENGWEREYADTWGTTEGTIRLTREAGGSVAAGISITVVMHEANGLDESDFDVYINGTDELAAGKWSITELNPTDGSGFNLNPDDDIWIMQGGSWIENSTGSNPSYHDDEYTGYVLYGWTATGWPGSDPAGSTQFSNLYPACECFNTNVSGLSNQNKVKYTGPMTDATKLDWINRFNDESNWIGYASDADYDAGTPDYRNNGVTIGILPGGFESGRWTATYDTDWFNCHNWQNLTIPNETTDVLVSTTYASDNAVVDSSDNALCHDLIIESDIGIDYSDDTYTGNTIEIHGDLLNQSSGTNIISTGGKMLFASDETAEITTNEALLYDVEFNGAGDFTLLDDMNVDETLTLTEGVVSTGTNKIHVQNTGTGAISDHSAASYINGNLRRNITGAGLYDLPVGNSSFYELASLDITSANNLSYIDAFFENSDLGAINISLLNIMVNGSFLTSVLDAGYWQIEPNAGLTSIDYDIILNQIGATNAASVYEQHTVIKRPDALSDWTFQGIHDNVTQAINGGVVTAQASSLSSFSQFAIARSHQCPLAIELVDCNIACDPSGVLVEWITASELNSDYFCIQHSSDGNTWKTMKTHPAFGTTNIQQNYQVVLKNAPASGYYRLTEVDMNGLTTAYAPQYLNCDMQQRNNTMFLLFPNPATRSTRLSAVNNNTDYYKVVIINANGKTINTLNWEHPDESDLTINTEKLMSGIYNIQVFNHNNVYHTKLIVQ